MNTISIYNQRKERIVSILRELSDFLEEGKMYGAAIDHALIERIEYAISKVEDRPLKIVLVGGVSEGKTTLAAAWSGNYDKSTMEISQAESTDKITVYNSPEGYQLADTPGLFGFKENEEKQKYKDITKKYVSEADLVFYVMSSDNPIKDSQKDELVWLFNELGLLQRTVFILSRFDEEADIEDEIEFKNVFNIKRECVIERLKDFGIIQSGEEIEVVAVSADPYGKGIEYWLENMVEYKNISHISDLQKATSKKIESSGGECELALRTQRTIISDVLNQTIPEAQNMMESLSSELIRFNDVYRDLEESKNKVEKEIVKSTIYLKNFIINYFSDLIIQVKGTDINTFDDYFERNIGEKGIVIETKIENEFEKQVGNISSELNKFELTMDTSIQHYNSFIGSIARKGLKVGGDALKCGKLKIDNYGILAARDFLKINIKFKPYGAIKLADKINAGLGYFGAIVGVGLEIWDSYDEYKKKETLEKVKGQMVEDFNKQREEYLSLLNDKSKIIDLFFPNYSEIEDDIKEMQKEMREKEEYRTKFEEWKNKGQIIDAEFTVITNR